jgi:capsular polysaccharide biosynthesis protein
VQALCPLGFEVIIPGGMPIDEQLRAFAEAEAVVAPHGAGLVNLLACESATVVELFHPHYVNGCYYAMADALGLPYWCVVGDAADRDSFVVPPTAVTASLGAADLG